ncbi:MAG: hypothetical protein ABJO86_14315 [Lentilitoribacter sp.]
MDQHQKQELYEAFVKNEASLKSALNHMRLLINIELRSKKSDKITSLTKTYAFLFCSWSESNFSKVIHTPYGLTISEIEDIQSKKKKKGIGEAWKECVEISAHKLEAKKSNFTPNVKQKLNRLIKDHVVDPSILRNKLAHGQWVVALNSNNTAINDKLTTEISKLDLVKISSWVELQKMLADTISSLVSSPNKAFMRDWYKDITKIEETIQKNTSKTLERHIEILDRRSRPNTCQNQ